MSQAWAGTAREAFQMLRVAPPETPDEVRWQIAPKVLPTDRELAGSTVDDYLRAHYGRPVERTWELLGMRTF